MREIAPGVSWIEECYDLGDRHEHVSVYLLQDPDGSRSVLVDTGSFLHREAITEQVAAATGEGGLDALVLSHSDYPHAANVDEFAPAGGEVELVASSTAPLAQGLPPDTRRVSIGDTEDVAGRELDFLDPPLADRSHTTWVYDHDTRGLFVADGFGSYHQPGECDRTSADVEDGIPYPAIRDFHDDTFDWLRFVDPARLRAALEAILDEYPPAYVAPIHGHPVMAKAVDGFVDHLIEAAREIAAAAERGPGRPSKSGR